jgi:FkbM family methyltransferase
MNQFERMVKQCFRLLGLDVSRINKTPARSPILHHEIDLLLDVGANTGQYALEIRKLGYKNRIVSFEPLLQAHQALVQTASGDAEWIVHERCAIGAAAGHAEINISRNSVSSSLLPMLPAHADAAPESCYLGKEVIDVVTLDSTFSTYHRHEGRSFLKIDTQGYERQVLEGASRWLEHLVGVQLELSIVMLYEHQALYDYFFNFFKDHGFELWALVPGFKDASTGRLLQFDGVFVNASVARR